MECSMLLQICIGLSLCGKILESAESTFGYVVSLIGACELIYIKK